jgi:hypothetical protein
VPVSLPVKKYDVRNDVTNDATPLPPPLVPPSQTDQLPDRAEEDHNAARNDAEKALGGVGLRPAEARTWAARFDEEIIRAVCTTTRQRAQYNPRRYALTVLQNRVILSTETEGDVDKRERDRTAAAALAEREQARREQWQEVVAVWNGLGHDRQNELIAEARRRNPFLRDRMDDSPVVIGAARNVLAEQLFGCDASALVG